MDDIRSYVEQHRAEHARELADWIAVPSISATGEGMDRAPNYALNLLRDSGLAVQLVETGGGPLIVGHAEGASPHVVIYGHYDVQPPGPLSEWDSPPFELTERAGRFYGRGTGDNKGQHLAQLLGLRAVRDCRGALPCAVTVLLDGEEELGSPNLESALRGMDLDGDLVIWSDGPVHESGEPTVCLGVRGIVTFEITVRGADLPLHSGNWGGVAPNPAWELVWLLSTLRSAEGRIGLDWNAPELTDTERSALAALPVDVPATLNSVGLDRMDVPLHKDFSERLAEPVLTINSLSCMDDGDHRTVIPSVAVARCDIRLAGGQRSEPVIAALRDHVARHLPSAEVRITRGVMEASRTLPESPYTAAVLAGVREATGREPVLVPALGGSLPIAALSDGLGLPCYGVPLANVDEANHAPNENLEVRRFHEGIVTAASVLLHLSEPFSQPMSHSGG